jgi:integrase
MDDIPTSLDASEKSSSSKTHRLKATGVQGLYVEKNAGTYYARYSLNGKRCVRCLNTKHFEVARLRHAKLHPVHEVARQTGVQTDASLRTLGSLAQYLMQEIEAASSSYRTKVMYKNWISRLRTHWQQGDFDTTLARNVTRATILELRTYLSEEALTLCGQWKDRRKGYSPAVVNQTLSMLRIILKTAVLKNAIAANPFSEESPFSNSIYVPRESREPEIPSNETLERVFADMAEVDTSNLDPVSAKYFINHAENSAEFARFLAYSGLRSAEAAAARVEDVRGNFLFVRGTKTSTSRRQVPINANLRDLLDKILSKRIGGPLLGVKNCLKALQRSCKRLNLEPLRQHDLRHYFATLSIESGVPIPTVADWLGHADGGVLLLKTYRHLRDIHSEQSAALIQRLPAQLNRA